MKRPIRQFLKTRKPDNDLPVPIHRLKFRCSAGGGSTLRGRFKRYRMLALQWDTINGRIRISPIRYPKEMTPKQRKRWAEVRLVVAQYSSNNR